MTRAAADIGWREFFPDPQLQQLIALALTNNRDLRVAVLNVQSAQAQYRIQRAQLFPTIDASAVEQAERIPIGVLEAEVPSGVGAGGGGGTASAPPSGITVHTYNVGVGFTNYELDLFGRIRSLSHAALQQYFSSGETRRSVQLTLVAEVATAYITVLTDQTLLDITRDTLKSQEDVLRAHAEAVQRRHEHGARAAPGRDHGRYGTREPRSVQPAAGVRTAMRCSSCSARRFRTVSIFPAAWTAQIW